MESNVRSTDDSGRLNGVIAKLDQLLTELGVDSKFRDNPAYQDVLMKIRGAMPVRDIEILSAFIENGVISFSTLTEKRQQCYVEVTAGPNGIRCVSSCNFPDKFDETKGGYSTTYQSDIVNARVDSNGRIAVLSGSTLLDDTGLVSGTMCRSNFSKEIYSAEGIVVEHELGQTKEGRINSFAYFDRNNSLEIATYPVHFYQNDNIWNNCAFISSLQSYSKVQRKNIDTASVYSFDKDNDSEERATVELGGPDYSHMQVMSVENYPDQHVIIPPLSTERIEEMVSYQTNPKVQEGLRKMAVGRENYSYDSLKDPTFKYVGPQEQAGVSR